MRPYQDAVTDAPTHVDYADVVDLRRALGVSSTDAAATADIQHAIAVASRQIDGYCGREFYRARSTANFVGIPRVITVSRYPLITVHSITTTAGGEALPYRPSYSALLYDGPHGAWGDAVLDYTGGYILPGAPDRTIPADLEQACLDLARGVYTRRSRAPDIVSESLAGIADVTFQPQAIPLGVRALLDPYRAISV